MKDFSRGVSYYTKATVDIGFPENDCVCVWCPLMTRDPNLRDVCGKTGELLTAPKYFRGLNCPLRFEEENHEE